MVKKTQKIIKTTCGKYGDMTSISSLFQRNVVYCAHNLYNNKKYIGKTSRSIGERIMEHWISSATDQQCKHFHRALKKYPPFVWKWYVLYHGRTDDDLKRVEIDLIKHFDSIKNGYNLSEGGDYDKFREKFDPNPRKFYRLPVRKLIL